jgi:hypothetical protein
LAISQECTRLKIEDGYLQKLKKELAIGISQECTRPNIGDGYLQKLKNELAIGVIGGCLLEGPLFL